MEGHMKAKSILCAAIAASAALSAKADASPEVGMRLFAEASPDGFVSEWKGAPQFEMKKPDVPDLGCEFAAAGWTKTHLLVAVSVRDSKIVNANPIEQISNGDCMEFRFCPSE